MAKQKTDQEELVSRVLLKEWLEKLQQESWQLELLISGFALFGIYEARAWIDNIVLSSDTFGYSSILNVVDFTKLLLQGGWLIFFINLLTHVILRGLWIGAIGLRYVSQDIEYEDLDYSEQFTSFLKDKVGEYDDFIERLEKICSVLFAYTFLLFLLLLSLLMFLTFYAIAVYFAISLGDAGEPNMTILLLGFLYLMLGMIVFIDFISLGGLKRIKEPKVSKIYMYLYSFYSTITLSFLYRPLLYNFVDNKYTRRLFYLSVPYIFIILFWDSMVTNEGFPYWSSDKASEYGLLVSKLHYEDERKEWYNENNMKKELKKEKLPALTLSQLMNDDPYLEIFIKMVGNDQYLLDAEDGLKPFKKPGLRFSLFSGSTYKDDGIDSLRDARKLATKDLRNQRLKLRRLKRSSDNKQQIKAQVDSLSAVIRTIGEEWRQKEATYEKQKLEQTISTFLSHTPLYMDGIPIDKDLECFKYRHPNFEEYGLLCMYYTDTLALGQHTISLERDYYKKGKEEIITETFQVPFYKVR